MAQPHGFSWIEKPHLAAMAKPASLEELHWLRRQGIELLVSLTEEPLRRDWLEEAGMLAFRVPMEDMEAPSQEQLDRCISAINRALERQMGVGVHCGAGLGRTGVVLACYLVVKGHPAENALARVRRLRPGSVETDDQAEAVREFAGRHQQQSG
jgi:atypical dual specificity phosphatase